MRLAVHRRAMETVLDRPLAPPRPRRGRRHPELGHGARSVRRRGRRAAGALRTQCAPRPQRPRSAAQVRAAVSRAARLRPARRGARDRPAPGMGGQRRHPRRRARQCRARVRAGEQGAPGDRVPRSAHGERGARRARRTGQPRPGGIPGPRRCDPLAVGRPRPCRRSSRPRAGSARGRIGAHRRVRPRRQERRHGRRGRRAAGSDEPRVRVHVRHLRPRSRDRGRHGRPDRDRPHLTPLVERRASGDAR